MDINLEKESELKSSSTTNIGKKRKNMLENYDVGPVIGYFLRLNYFKTK